MNIVREKRAQKLAAKSGGKEIAYPAADREYQLILMRLNHDKQVLKNMQSIAAKTTYKAEILNNYKPWVDGVLTIEKPVYDEVVMTILAWSIDAGDYDYGLDIAEFALKHDFELPPQFGRTLPTFIAEEIANASLQDGAVDQSILNRVRMLTEKLDMFDQVRAKLIKASGLKLLEIAESNSDIHEYEQAIAELEQALAIDSKVGAKKIIEQSKKRLEELKLSQTAALDNV